MNNKICTKCKQKKSLSDFYKDSGQNSGYRPDCKACVKITRNKYKNNSPCNYILAKIKDKCKQKNNKYYGGKGIKCLISLDDIKYLWERDKAYLLIKPSLDRKNPNKNYDLDNCQFIEWSENMIKDKRKPILQFDLDGNFIKEFKSTKEVEKILGFSHNCVGRVALGKRKSAYGYKWKYKNE